MCLSVLKCQFSKGVKPCSAHRSTTTLQSKGLLMSLFLAEVGVVDQVKAHVQDVDEAERGVQQNPIKKHIWCFLPKLKFV